MPPPCFHVDSSQETFRLLPQHHDHERGGATWDLWGTRPADQQPGTVVKVDFKSLTNANVYSQNVYMRYIYNIYIYIYICIIDICRCGRCCCFPLSWDVDMCCCYPLNWDVS